MRAVPGGGRLDAWLAPLNSSADSRRFGGKAARLAGLIRAGFRVPSGFAVPVSAYEAFVSQGKLERVIEMELGRRPLQSMRWEELWDAALRIRVAFLRSPVPRGMSEELRRAAKALGGRLAVRSSAPEEDARSRSFAGLHETVLEVSPDKLDDALRVVWSSLWSDAALLYRRELGLNPSGSRMAVVIQRLEPGAVSGVAFGDDPRVRGTGRSVIEAVRGRCDALVDGAVDPDHWELNKGTGKVLDFRAGEGRLGGALLGPRGIGLIHGALVRAKKSLGFEPDLEWTLGRALVLLQARPITRKDRDKKRGWYMTLKPGDGALAALRQRVTEDVLPALEAEGSAMRAEDLASLDNAALAALIAGRLSRLAHWRRVYEKELIPFAHGVRRLGAHYAAAVKPRDPFEFVKLLGGQEMKAGQRILEMERLASRLRRDASLKRRLKRSGLDADAGFAARARSLMAEHLDLEFAGERLLKREDVFLANLFALSEVSSAKRPRRQDTAGLRKRYLRKASDPAQAREILETALLSWRLRDDDNILLGRIESQALAAIEEGAARLRRRGRLAGPRAAETDGAAIARALKTGGRLRLAKAGGKPALPRDLSVRIRQLTGQPASPGLAMGAARIVATPEDLKAFRPGEVLVCDAIQPNMTHLVPLASAIVERRGGMLIHGAIVARELGIPCVNGVPDAAERIHTGELVTVDGHLGLVSIGTTEMEAEFTPPPGKRSR